VTDKYVVTAQWDDEAEVWVATSEDVPGLVTEAATLDTLYARVVAVVPELLEDNAHLLSPERRQGGRIDLHIVSEFLTAAQ
jgi:hypothetical protein